MRFLLIAAAAALSASRAQAADKLEFAPPSAWVKPAQAPASLAPPDATDVQFLLSDHQDRFGANGQESYVRNVWRANTPQGLSSLTNMGVTWSPDTDAVTIHHLRIIRGAKVIDVLADQTFTVLRRETNLEVAALNGQLTATIQPEGLETGDIVDFAFTQRRRDPTLQGKSEFLNGFSLPMPISRLRVRELWPASQGFQWRTTAGLARPVASHTPDGEELLFDISPLAVLKAPAEAPARYQALRQLQVTQFKSWNEVSALTAGLFAKASELKADSPLKAQATAIANASVDPKARATAALRLVEDKVRYVFLGMNLGGYVPAAADLTWSRRFGDCKGKTVVLLALLHELGIEAEPALVSTLHGDGLDERLPMLGIFDHVVVRATIAGKTYWLDATRIGDRDLDRLPALRFHWALPMRAGGTGLERLALPPFDQPMEETQIHLDASGGGDALAPAHVEKVIRGDTALIGHHALAAATPTDRDSFFKEFWKNSYDWITVDKSSETFDEATGEERLIMDGKAKLSWTAGGDGRGLFYFSDATLGRKTPYEREPGTDTKAPFTIGYPFYDSTIETVVLPVTGIGFELVGGDVDTTVAGRHYRRVMRLNKGVAIMETSTRALAPEFPASDAAAASKALRALWDVDPAIKAPANVKATPDNLDRIVASTPTTAGAFMIRAGIFVGRRQFDRALADFQQAAKLDPTNTKAYVGQGFSQLNLGDFKSAGQAFDKAQQINPDAPGAASGKAALALHEKRYQDAIKGFDIALAAIPSDEGAVRGRAEAHIALGDTDAALADLAQAQAANANDIEIYLDRAKIFASRKQDELAFGELDKMVALQPKNADAYSGRADFLRAHGKSEAAVKDYDRAIALDPSYPQMYLARALARAPADRAARMADVDQALKLAPSSADAHQVRASIFEAEKAYSEAAREYRVAMTLAPDDEKIPLRRYQALARGHDWVQADAALGELMAAHPDRWDLYNTRCWDRATNGGSLSAALADCDTALKLKPDSAAALDSRGFVRLKLGQFALAQADYDAALKLRPKLAASLFGRGVVELRLGKAQQGQADLTAARAIEPKIDEQFAGYGLKP